MVLETCMRAASWVGWVAFAAAVGVGCGTRANESPLPATADAAELADAGGGAEPDAGLGADAGGEAEGDAANAPDAGGGEESDAASAPDAGGEGGDAAIASDATPAAYYYPPSSGDTWETADPAALGWDLALLEDALTYAASVDSTAVIILYRGKILLERYWQNWDAHSSQLIASASKSFTSFLIGMLKKDGLVDLDAPVSNYLGLGWSSAPADKEAMITVRHLLSMSSGLDDDLAYAADAGTVWLYNTPAYYKLGDVIASASGMSRDDFADARLHAAIGLQDTRWRPNSLVSSARDMSRFGLLILSGGTWETTSLLDGATYLDEALNSSQTLNPSYGFLFWLNGKNSYLLPGNPARGGSGPMMPDAPADLVAALGAGDKKIYVVKSMDLVVVRHGGSTGEPALAASGFDNVFWQKLMLAAP